MKRLSFSTALAVLLVSSPVLAQSGLILEQHEGGSLYDEAHYSYMPAKILTDGKQYVDMVGDYRAYALSIDASFNLGFVHFLEDVKEKLSAQGFQLGVYCVEECGKREYINMIDDTYRYNTLYQIGYINARKNQFGYLSAFKPAAEGKQAVMIFASQERDGGLKYGYEQVISSAMPDAGIRVKQDFDIKALDFSQLKAEEKDAKGTSDHPLIERFPGSYIKSAGVSDFESYPLITGQYRKHIPVQQVEGRVTTLNYRINRSVGTYAVHKNYMNALTNAGFEVIYECEAKNCGNYILRDNYKDTIFSKRYDSDIYNMTKKKNFYLFTAQKEMPSGKVYTSMYSYQNRAEDDVELVVDIIEEKDISHTPLNIDSDSLGKEIKATGSVSLYGIEFDFDDHTIKPSSKPQLDEIADFLKKSEQVSLYVVGHTDNKGSFSYNQDLAARRAREVVNTLIRDYSIGKGRLQAVGVGPVAPLAANDSEGNMQRNRRVELVLKEPMSL